MSVQPDQDLILMRWRNVLDEIARGELDEYDAAEAAQKALGLVCEVPTCYRLSGGSTKLCEQHLNLYHGEYAPRKDAPAMEKMANYYSFLNEVA